MQTSLGASPSALSVLVRKAAADAADLDADDALPPAPSPPFLSVSRYQCCAFAGPLRLSCECIASSARCLKHSLDNRSRQPEISFAHCDNFFQRETIVNFDVSKASTCGIDVFQIV
eukprot:4325361-Pleurochrysis_carterae.AAC.1